MTAAAIVSMDYPPSANRIWRYTGGRALKSAEYRSWIEAMVWAVRMQREPCISGSYALHVSVVRPDKRRRDIDNLLKPISDVLVAAGVVEDDSLAQSITIEWADAPQSHGVKVRVIGTKERA